MMSVSEEEEGGQKNILYIEIDGDLVGIDLSRHGSSNLEQSSEPPLLPTCFCLDLPKHHFPLYMRHFKLEDKVYFLGGLFHDHQIFNHSSPNVYEFHPQPHAPPQDALSLVSHLNDPKVAIVANLRGTIYALRYWMHCGPHDFYSRFGCTYLFECYDSTEKIWRQAPCPPALQELLEEVFDYNSPHEPGEKFVGSIGPLILSHFVIDHKLFLLFDDDFVPIEESFQVFDHLTQRWEVFDGEPFLRKPGICLFESPFETAWLSKIQFPPPINSSSGVLLTIERAFSGSLIDPVSRSALHVYAFVCSETPGYFDYFQQLDEVFADISPDDDDICSPGYRDSLHDCHSYCLVDVGEGAQESQRRFCAVLMNGSRVFISTFDVQPIPSPIHTPLPSSGGPQPCEFLKIFPVKKLVFKYPRQPNLVHCRASPLFYAFFL